MAKKIKPDEGLKVLEERKHRREPPPVRYQPNLTPLIDVLFLLLLFFLLGTRFRQEEGQIPGSLPQLGGPAAATIDNAPPPPDVKIEVSPAGSDNMAAFYTIANLRDATPITDPEALHEALAKMYASYGKEEAKAVPILIKPASDVRWGFVVEVFNQAARAKFTNIGFAPVGS